MIRFRLRTLLLTLVVIGLAAGWASDHLRLRRRIDQLLTANNAQRDQLNVLKQQRAAQISAIQINYWWASADEFIEMVKTAADEMTFIEKAPSLAGADPA